jgi:hypothetical protein
MVERFRPGTRVTSQTGNMGDTQRERVDRHSCHGRNAAFERASERASAVYRGKCRRPRKRVSELCELFGISRKQAHNWKARYDTGGSEGLVDRLRAPHSHARAASPELAQLVVGAQETSHLGPCKAARGSEKNGTLRRLRCRWRPRSRDTSQTRMGNGAARGVHRSEPKERFLLGPQRRVGRTDVGLSRLRARFTPDVGSGPLRIVRPDAARGFVGPPAMVA